MSHWTHFVTEADIETQWDDPEYLEALECEARSAEHKGLMVCGDDEWGCR